MAAFDVGVMGNGTANSRPAALRFTGDFVGDREGEEGGTSDNIERPFGDADARVRVSEDAFETATDVVRGGRSAQGMFGIGVTSR